MNMKTKQISGIKKQWKEAISSPFVMIMTNCWFFLTNKLLSIINDAFSGIKGVFPASKSIVNWNG